MDPHVEVGVPAHEGGDLRILPRGGSGLLFPAQFVSETSYGLPELIFREYMVWKGVENFILIKKRS